MNGKKERQSKTEKERQKNGVLLFEKKIRMKEGQQREI